MGNRRQWINSSSESGMIAGIITRMGLVAIIVGIFGLVVSFGLAELARYGYNSNCGGYLNNAATASTVEYAHQMLSKAVADMERTGRTSGSTALIFHTPDRDVGLWYKNHKDLRDELAAVPASASVLERTNLLMKVREVVSKHPYNIHIVHIKWPAALLSWGSAAFAFFGVVLLAKLTLDISVR